jgi:hypothetical protein
VYFVVGVFVRFSCAASSKAAFLHLYLKVQLGVVTSLRWVLSNADTNTISKSSTSVKGRVIESGAVSEFRQ